MLEKIKEEIIKANTIVITGHILPDGDCLGAALALKNIIEKFDKNKSVKVCFNYELPNYLLKLEYKDEIYKTIENDVDLLISVDVAVYSRLAIDESIIKKAKKTINIDHHISNSKYFDINYVQEKSSASEMIYDFLNLLYVELDEKIAQYIYLGIINDTGNFRHNNFDSKTFYICSKLLETGINNSYISRVLFSKSKNKAKVFSKSIIEGKYFEKIKTQIYYLSQKEMKENGYTSDDIDGTSEYMLSIDNVEVAVFVREMEDGKLKASMRSKNIDINEIAKLFNGGGHKLAAGFMTDYNIEKIEDIIINAILSA